MRMDDQSADEIDWHHMAHNAYNVIGIVTLHDWIGVCYASKLGTGCLVPILRVVLPHYAIVLHIVLSHSPEMTVSQRVIMGNGSNGSTIIF